MLKYNKTDALVPKSQKKKQFTELKVWEGIELIFEVKKYSFEGLVKSVQLLNDYINLNLEALEKVKIEFYYFGATFRYSNTK